MKLLAVDEYIRFECIGSKCPVSCCGGNWGITIDDESYDYYMSIEGEFGSVLRNGITKLKGANAFKLDEKTRDCVFLDEEKLCIIYRNLGPDSLCETCRAYPRAFYDVGDIEFCYLANSCPEVNRMIMQRMEPFDTLYDDSEDESGSFAGEGFSKALSAMIAGLELLKNRKITVKDRFILLLIYIKKYQEYIRNGRNPESVTGLFSDPGIYIRFLENEFTEQEGDIVEKIHVFMIVYRSLMKDSYDHPMWRRCNDLAECIIHDRPDDMETIRRAFALILHDDIQIELEQLVAYRFFAVFMQGYKENDYYERTVYEVIMLIVLEAYIALTDTFQHYECSQDDRIMFYSLCGRIEHTRNQKEKLVRELQTGGYYELDNLIKLIC